MKRALILILAALLFPAMVQAAQPSGTWVTDLAPDGTVSAAQTGESGASIFVIDTTAFRKYTGSLMGFFNGVTLSGVSNPLASATGWAPALSTGISVYWTQSAVNAAASTSLWRLLPWTLISSTGGTVRSGNTYFAFDIPADPAAPYVGLKCVFNGASPFAFGLKAAGTAQP